MAITDQDKAEIKQVLDIFQRRSYSELSESQSLLVETANRVNSGYIAGTLSEADWLAKFNTGSPVFQLFLYNCLFATRDMVKIRPVHAAVQHRMSELLRR